MTNNEKPRKYWNDLNSKLNKEGSELSEKIGQLKMQVQDGRMRMRDVQTFYNDLFILSYEIYFGHLASER